MPGTGFLIPVKLDSRHDESGGGIPIGCLSSDPCLVFEECGWPTGVLGGQE